MAEKEQRQKQEIPAMRGTFAVRGIVTAFNKTEPYEKKTKTGKDWRKIQFDVTSSEGNIHKMQIQAFVGEKVYFSGRVKDETGADKTVVEEVYWNDRLKYKKDGFLPIDRVSFGLKKVTNAEGKEENEKHTKVTYDAIEDIYNLLEVGMSVYVRGNIQVEEYTRQDGAKGNTTRLIPTQISLTQAPIDFNAEDFQETATFELQAIAEEIEVTGSEEVTITGLFIGNQRLGRQTLVFKNDPSMPEGFDLAVWINGCRNLQRAPKYVSAIFAGNMVNTANQESVSQDDGAVDEFGFPTSYVSPLRNRGTGYRREFLCSGIVPSSIDKDTYTEENVDTFITQFIKPRSEFGETTPDASGFLF